MVSSCFRNQIQILDHGLWDEQECKQNAAAMQQDIRMKGIELLHFILEDLIVFNKLNPLCKHFVSSPFRSVGISISL